MTIRSEDVKTLRAQTGVGMMDCKRALQKADGDLEKAKKILREEGLELIGHKGREANEGGIFAYVHHSGKVGVLLDVSANTDFAAKSADFVTFANDVAMHIAAVCPRYVAPEDVPQSDLEEEKDIYRAQLRAQGKPDAIIEKALDGRVAKFYTEVCLLKQPFVKDPSETVEDLLASLRTKTGENVMIRRFARFSIGE
ncbi:elongation factor Ts [Candidatus Bipolaricaulota bacterium]|nr:elongation factor Ts [Candidatus Bipolaricaulota bacterium]